MFGNMYVPGPMAGWPSHTCDACNRLQFAGSREEHESWCPRLPPRAASESELKATPLDEGSRHPPCPFCGGEPIVGQFDVECDNAWCEAQPSTAGQSQAEAIAGWNRRAPVAAIPDRSFAIIKGRTPCDDDRLELAVHDGVNFVCTDGDCFERDGDTLDGYTAEFLTQYELEQRLNALGK